MPTYPDVSVSLTGGAVAGLRAALAPYDGKNIDQPTAPTTPGIGEVWVDTQYEESARKGPGLSQHHHGGRCGNLEGQTEDRPAEPENEQRPQYVGEP